MCPNLSPAGDWTGRRHSFLVGFRRNPDPGHDQTQATQIHQSWEGVNLSGKPPESPLRPFSLPFLIDRQIHLQRLADFGRLWTGRSGLGGDSFGELAAPEHLTADGHPSDDRAGGVEVDGGVEFSSHGLVM